MADMFGPAAGPVAFGVICAILGWFFIVVGFEVSEGGAPPKVLGLILLVAGSIIAVKSANVGKDVRRAMRVEQALATIAAATATARAPQNEALVLTLEAKAAAAATAVAKDKGGK